MTRGQKWFVAICLGLGLLIGPFILIAQQQYSGGQTVTIGNASLPVTQSGTWTVQPGNTANTTAWKVDGSAVTQPVSGTVTVNALPAGTSKIGIAYPYTGCGTAQFESGSPAGVAAMPTVATAITSTTTCLVTLEIANTSGGALTVTVSDNAGTPINFLNAVSMAAGERDQYTFPNGMKFNAGIKVSASGSGITYYALGVQ